MAPSPHKHSGRLSTWWPQLLTRQYMSLLQGTSKMNRKCSHLQEAVAQETATPGGTPSPPGPFQSPSESKVVLWPEGKEALQ